MANFQNSCPFCLETKCRFQSAITLGIYQDSLHQATLKMKKLSGQNLAYSLGKLLYKKRLQYIDTTFDYLVPIPVSYRKWVTQGYQTAAQIGRGIAAVSQIPLLPKALRLTREIQKQALLPKTTRIQNTKNAFKPFYTKRLQDKSILLVDDILTTAATANEATKALLHGGARSVVVATICRATIS
ncbi:MAG: hypothetical protein MPJ24_04200 [Pirellulaceae bacterium]|nr:hypothetical protein [Pirellulaceae bacterium]